MAVASFNEIAFQVIARINAGTANTYPTNITDIDAVTADDRFSSGELKEMILLTDLDVRKIYARSGPRNGHWQAMCTVSGDLLHRAAIPEHEGVLGEIEIKVNEDDTIYIPPKDDVVTPTDIEMYRANPDNAFGTAAHDAAGSPIAGYLAIRGDIVSITGYRWRVQYIPPFTIDRATPACQSPVEATPMIVKGVIERMVKEGYVTADVFQMFGKLYSDDAARVEAGRAPLAPDA